jgi:glycosyltransferase involved in cell wall biosynthesis
MKAKHSILFVSHDGSRTGAPLVLLNIIREYKKISSRDFKILIINDGPLASEFQSLGKTFIWFRSGKKHNNFLLNFVSAFFKVFVSTWNKLWILYNLRNSALIFYNTITNGHIHKKLKWINAKSVCYVHEMDISIRKLTNPEILSFVITNTDLFIVVSVAVKNDLVVRHKIEAEKIRVVYPSVEVTEREKADYISFAQEFKKRHGLQADHVVIGVVGTSEWRKGFDLFFPMISVYRNLFPEDRIFFVWKGYRAKNDSSFFDLYDIEKSGVIDSVAVLPHGNDNIECIAMFDVHLLLSREDSYPLVMLEAASLGIPTIGFENAGGVPEFVEDDCGFIVPYGNLLELARKTHCLVKNKDLNSKYGAAARKKVHERHTSQIMTRQIYSLVESLLSHLNQNR